MSLVRAVPLIAALALAACNTLETATAPAPAAPVNPNASVATLDIPFGEPCGAELSAYKSVMDNDLRTGHVNKPVYDKVINELRPAVAACQAARSYEAIALMNATKRRFGYPVPQGEGPVRRRDLAGGT
ncbi:hypothetical protein [Blastochloris viridis]|uniref:Lipoprotein n=1 Tax=Blastochloris viridis TaxID=1079 RepID=A0A0H5BPC1_BLAVI|nr:hypothetical protein [Blastochloris viridis]ALK10962.1 hypothetical protein BVIR_3205 [Blastochloris viridis]BAR99053.1 hypothetical protein BV133_1460 [Blastochloris viridis]CUU43624.1 hypothetical protein BVIRIDIS_26490 [Blastochloris viridis]